MPKRTSNNTARRGRTPMMDRLMQRIYDTKNAHLFSVASALAAIQESRAEKALSSDGRVLRELLESAEDLKAHGLVSPEDMAHMAALCELPPENPKP